MQVDVLSDVRPAPGEPAALYCATGSGIAVFSIRETGSELRLELKMRYAGDARPVRRVVPAGAGWLGITGEQGITGGHEVFRAGPDGITWRRDLGAPVYDAVVSQDGARAFVATEAGLVELATADGCPVSGRNAGERRVRGVVQTLTGDRVVITDDGLLERQSAVDGRALWRLPTSERVWRAWAQNDFLYATGAGGVREFEVGRSLICRWFVPPTGAAVHATVVDGLLIALGQDGRPAFFDHETAEYLGTAGRPGEDAVSLAVLRTGSDVPVLVIAHRDGLLSSYRLDRGIGLRGLARLPDQRLAAAALR